MIIIKRTRKTVFEIKNLKNVDSNVLDNMIIFKLRY